MSENTLPHSQEAEMMVLGCMILAQDALNEVVNDLHEEDFYFNEHKLIFRGLYELYKRDSNVDTILLAEHMKESGNLEAVGGVLYLTNLTHFAGVSTYADEYTQIVKNKSMLRGIISASKQAEKKALKANMQAEEILEDTHQVLYRLENRTRKKAITDIRDMLKEDSEKPSLIERIAQRREEFLKHGPLAGVSGIKTHFHELDNCIDGLNGGNLIILGARPSMGKTALMLNIATNIALKENMPVGIMSLEMTTEQVLYRILSDVSKVEAKTIRNGSQTGEDLDRVIDAALQLKESHILIDDTPGLKIGDVRSRAMRMQASYGIKCLFVDYLQLISSGSRKVENRQTEISDVSNSLKILARKLDIPVFCCAQLSRKVEERTAHRPMMSDLRDSGSLEQDADVVLFLLRRDHYDPYDRPGKAEIIVSKNRHGSIGDIDLCFNSEYGSFCNPEDSLEQSFEEIKAEMPDEW